MPISDLEGRHGSKTIPSLCHISHDTLQGLNLWYPVLQADKRSHTIPNEQRNTSNDSIESQDGPALGVIAMQLCDSVERYALP